MGLTPDQQKALEHIAQERRRGMFQRSLQARLRAPANPAATTKMNWAPLTTTGIIKGQKMPS